jgi:hypothetical protein
MEERRLHPLKMDVSPALIRLGERLQKGATVGM